MVLNSKGIEMVSNKWQQFIPEIFRKHQRHKCCYEAIYSHKICEYLNVNFIENVASFSKAIKANLNKI